VWVLFASAAAQAAGGNEEENEVAAASNAEAKKRFTEGNERYARGDYEAAVESFRAAIAADPKLPGPYRNLGLAYRALNRCSDALPVYERYLELKPESRFTERVRREIEFCRAKMGQSGSSTQSGGGPRSGGGGSAHAPEAQSILHVAANLIGGEATDEATVKVDGLVRGATPLTIPITAGTHVVFLSRAGFESASARIEVAPGERRDVELTMNKLEQEPVPVVVSPTREPEPTGPKKSYKKYGWIFIGVAAITAAIGAGFGIAESALRRDAVAQPTQEITRGAVAAKHDTGTGYAAIAYTGLSVSGAALLTAAIIFIVDPSRGETHEHAGYYTLAPAVDQKSAGLVATVRF
jgi:hypothetical protein